MTRNRNWNKLRPTVVQREASRERRARHGRDKSVAEDREMDARTRKFFGKELQRNRNLQEILEAAHRIEEAERLNAEFFEWKTVAVPERDRLRAGGDPMPTVNESKARIADELDELLAGFPVDLPLRTRSA